MYLSIKSKKYWSMNVYLFSNFIYSFLYILLQKKYMSLLILIIVDHSGVQTSENNNKKIM